MAITVPNALTAGVLAQEITVANALIASISTMQNDGGFITGGSLSGYDPITGNFWSWPQIQQLSPQESATIFATMISVLQARVTGWQSQLSLLPVS